MLSLNGGRAVVADMLPSAADRPSVEAATTADADITVDADTMAGLGSASALALVAIILGLTDTMAPRMVTATPHRLAPPASMTAMDTGIRTRLATLRIRTKALRLARLLPLVTISAAAHAQYAAVGVGGVQNHSANIGNQITNPAIVTAEGGLKIISFLDGAVHYSFARPQIQQDTRYAAQALPTHTLTFDARVHSPEARASASLAWSASG